MPATGARRSAGGIGNGTRPQLAAGSSERLRLSAYMATVPSALALVCVSTARAATRARRTHPAETQIRHRSTRESRCLSHSCGPCGGGHLDSSAQRAPGMCCHKLRMRARLGLWPSLSHIGCP